MDWCKWSLLTVLLMAVPACTRAAEPPAFMAYSAGKADVIVSADGENHLSFGWAMWGPNWAWTGLEGKTRSENGVTIGELGARMGGTDVPIRLDFRASRVGQRTLKMEYSVQAEADTGITMMVAQISPGKTFDGQETKVVANGRNKTIKIPLEKRGVGEQVESMQMTDKAGRVTILRFSPAIDIASDGAARVMLASGKLAAGDVRRVAVTVELPGEVQWFASANEIPDEPSLATWYPWQGKGDAADSLLSMADWSRNIGGSGRVTRQGNQLMFNGQPLKLWGLNLCFGATAPEKALADKRAAFYPRYGINAVRLHKWADGHGWSGIQSKDSAIEFDPAALDRMDYQVAKLKEAGIFIKLSANFGALQMGPAEKKYVPWMEEFGSFKNNRIATPHSAIHYSPELQQVQILQMANLLKHKNPYTGLTYAQDPAISFVEIINEQSILFFTSMNPLKASATLRKQVGQRFGDWLRQKYGTHQKLQAAWGAEAMDMFAGDIKVEGGENLDRNNILPLGNPWYWDPEQLNGSQKPRRQRLLDTLHFLTMLQDEFYARYTKAIREAGYTGEMIASNWQAGRAYSHFANLYSDSLIGTIDRHNYFGGNRADNTMFSRAGSGLLSSGMQQVADRPFMLSEWIHTFPNEMGVEGPSIVGAYGMGLQGWDVSYMFQNDDNGSFSNRLGRSEWDVTAPQVMGIFPAVARQVRRGDVQESRVAAVRNVHVPSLFQGQLGFEDKVEQGYDDKELDSNKVPARALTVARTEVAFTRQPQETPTFSLNNYQKNGMLVSTTNQLQWKEGAAGSSGFFTMNTPGTKAVVGFSAGQKFDLGAVTVEPKSRFSAIYVTARDQQSTLDNAKDVLIVAMARARNTGQKFSPTGDRMLSAGKGPILMEPVQAQITLRRAGNPQVFALDHDGRLTPTSITMKNGVFTIDGARDKTPYYVVRY
jgi:hypothetical protein